MALLSEKKLSMRSKLATRPAEHDKWTACTDNKLSPQVALAQDIPAPRDPPWSRHTEYEEGKQLSTKGERTSLSEKADPELAEIPIFAKTIWRCQVRLCLQPCLLLLALLRLLHEGVQNRKCVSAQRGRGTRKISLCHDWTRFWTCLSRCLGSPTKPLKQCNERN